MRPTPDLGSRSTHAWVRSKNYAPGDMGGGGGKGGVGKLEGGKGSKGEGEIIMNPECILSLTSVLILLL